MAPAKSTSKIKSNKLGQLNTPIGSALFVSCPNPSPFDENKQEASIILSADNYELFLKNLYKLTDACEQPLVIEKMKAKLPVKEAVDVDGNATGDMIIKTKTSMQYPAKFYDKDGKIFKAEEGYQVSNRSTIRISVSVELMDTAMYKGYVLRTNGIQVIADSGYGSASPFDAVETEEKEEETTDWAD